MGKKWILTLSNSDTFQSPLFFLGIKLRRWYQSRYPPPAFLDQLEESQPLLSQQNRVSFADPIIVGGIPAISEENKVHTSEVAEVAEVAELAKVAEVAEVPECNEPTNSRVLGHCQVHATPDDFVLETIVI